MLMVWPMMNIRKAAERGGANHGWLNTKHTFSFAEYYDPKQMGFRALRVINEDQVAPGQGFGTHGHRDMEIISYVLGGKLAHQDSTGSGGTIAPGEVQRMSAGSGVRHSEFNGSKTEPVHFLQIWIMPDTQGVTPSYEDKRFTAAEKQGRLKLIASPDAADGSTKINADTKVYATLLGAGEKVELPLARGRHGYVHVARGEVKVNGQAMSAGDGVSLSEEAKIALEGVNGAEVLLFDLA